MSTRLARHPNPSRPTAGAVPSVHRRALLTWLAVFPTITLVQLLLGPYIGGWPLVARTAVITAVAVPTSVYLLVPRLVRLAGGFRARG